MNTTRTEAMRLLDDVRKANPQLRVDLDPDYREERDARFRLTIDIGGKERHFGHIKPTTDWHTLYLMSSMGVVMFAEGEKLGRRNALTRISSSLARILEIEN